jgi:very-short-patch-repair endonuclease
VLERQERAVSTGQLKELGLSAKVIGRLRRDGWLVQKYRGVWIAGGGKLTPMGAFWAGHLATEGVISHRSASVVHALRASYWKVELTCPHYKPDRDGLLIHQSRHIQSEDHGGLPVTPLERTLLDLADVLTPRKLEIAITQADHDLDYRKLHALLLGANGRHGVTPLKHALQAHQLGATLTESALEEEFLKLLRHHGFARPRTQFHVLGYRCDFVWPEHRIVIETDGARWHRTRERDAQRDRELRRAGWTVDRVSYRQVFFRPAEVVLILEGNGVPRGASRPRRRPGRRPRPAA